MTDHFVGIDLGGTTITCVKADATGTIITRQQIDTDAHAGPQQVIARMGELTFGRGRGMKDGRYAAQPGPRHDAPTRGHVPR